MEQQTQDLSLHFFSFTNLNHKDVQKTPQNTESQDIHLHDVTIQLHVHGCAYQYIYYATPSKTDTHHSYMYIYITRIKVCSMRVERETYRDGHFPEYFFRYGGLQLLVYSF